MAIAMKNFFSISTLNNLKLSSKRNIIVVASFVVGLMVLNSALALLLYLQAETKLSDRATLIVETANAVRDYTSNQIQPELEERLKTDIAFLPETVPAYSARTVFENLQANSEEYQDVTYREATLNPTSPVDKADPWEALLIEQFRQNEELSWLKGYRQRESQKYYYKALPIVVSQTSCLQCHGNPEEAPKSLLNTYGTQNGFGWNLNEIVGAQIAKIPAQKILDTARDTQIAINIFFILILGGISLAYYWLIEYGLIAPIKKFTTSAKKIHQGQDDINFHHRIKDESGILAFYLNRMVTNFRESITSIREENKTAESKKS